MAKRHSKKKGQKTYFALETSKMVGKCARLIKAAPWARLLNSLFYTLIAFTIAQTKLILTDSSPKFQGLIKTMQCKNFSPRSKLNKDHESMVGFVLKTALRIVHDSPIEYNIVPSVREELDFFEEFLAPGSGVDSTGGPYCLFD